MSEFNEWAEQRADEFISATGGTWSPRTIFLHGLGTGAEKLLERARERFNKTEFVDPEGATGAMELLEHLEQLCGKEGKS